MSGTRRLSSSNQLRPLLADVADRADVRIIECGDGARASQSKRARRSGVVARSVGRISIAAVRSRRVSARFVHVAHATGAEHVKDFVRPEVNAGSNSQIRSNLTFARRGINRFVSGWTAGNCGAPPLMVGDERRANEYVRTILAIDTGFAARLCMSSESRVPSTPTRLSTVRANRFGAQGDARSP